MKYWEKQTWKIFIHALKVHALHFKKKSYTVRSLMKGSCCSFVDKEEVNCNFRVDDVQNEVTRERERNLTNPIKPVLVTLLLFSLLLQQLLICEIFIVLNHFWVVISNVQFNKYRHSIRAFKKNFQETTRRELSSARHGVCTWKLYFNLLLDLFRWKTALSA